MKKLVLIIMASLFLFSGCFEKTKSDVALTDLQSTAWGDKVLTGNAKFKISNKVGAVIKSYSVKYLSIDFTELGSINIDNANIDLEAGQESAAEVILVSVNGYDIIKSYGAFYCEVTFNIKDKNDNGITISKRIKITREIPASAMLDLKSIYITDGEGNKTTLNSGYEVSNTLSPEITIYFTDGITLDGESAVTSAGALKADGGIKVETISSMVTSAAVTAEVVANKITLRFNKLTDKGNYRVTILKNLLKGITGEFQKSTYSYDFSVKMTYPNITGSNPKNNSTEVDPLSGKIEIFTGKAIEESLLKLGNTTGATISLSENGIDISSGAELSISADKKVITVSYPLKEGKKYEAAIKKGGLSDIYGNSAEEDFKLTFNTKINSVTSYIEMKAIAISDGTDRTFVDGYTIKEMTQPKITMQFNDGVIVDRAKLGESFELWDLTAATKGALSVSAIANIVKAVPSSKLINGHDYRFIVKESLSGDKGEIIRQEYRKEFTVALNLPDVASTQPLNDNQNIDILNRAVITMNKAIDPLTAVIGTTINIYENGVNISSEVKKQITADFMTINLDWSFKEGKVYEVSLPDGGVKDIYGNSISGEKRLRFSIKSTQATTSYIELKSGAVEEIKGVKAQFGQGYQIINNLKPRIELTFTDGINLDKATLTSGAIKLEDITSAIITEVPIATPSGISIANQIVIIPLSALVDGHNYRVRVTKGIKGSGGEYLKESEYKIEFNTRITYPEVLLTTTPLNGSSGVTLTNQVTIPINKEIKTASVNGNTLIVTEKDKSGTVTTNASVTYNFSSDLKTITAGWAFKPATIYTIIMKDIEDLYGNQMAESKITFSTFDEQIVTVPVPTELSAAPGNGTVTLTWKEPSDKKGFNILGYNVYIGKDNNTFYLLNNGKTPNVELATSIMIKSGDGVQGGGITISTTGGAYYFKVTTVTEGNVESDKSNVAMTSIYDGSIPVLTQNEITANMGVFANPVDSTKQVAGVRLEWPKKKKDGIDVGYVIYRGITDTNSEGVYVKVSEIAAGDSAYFTTTTAFYIDSTIPAQKYIWYRIACKINGAEGIKSGAILARDEDPPATPDYKEFSPRANNGYYVDSLGASQDTNDKNLYLSWSANTERDLAGYKIYISNVSDGKYLLIKKTPFNKDVVINPTVIDSSVDGIGTTVTGYTATGDYFIKITAYDQSGNESLQSRYIAVRNVKLSTPTGLSGSNVSDHTTTPTTPIVGISWQKISGVNKYIVYRKEGAGGNWIQTSEVEGDKNYYEDGKVTLSTTYHYKVMAVDVYGNSSDISAETSAVPN